MKFNSLKLMLALIHNEDMKVVKEKKTGKKFRTVTLRIAEETMKKVDTVSEKNNVSRQKLIEAILEQVMADKSFVVKISE